MHWHPDLADWPDAGVYQLHVALIREIKLRIGSLGAHQLTAGEFVYTGRAARGLVARVRRHAIIGTRAQHRFRNHWHIDYLLSHAAARLTRIQLATGDPEAECRANQAIQGAFPIPGFGASDCTSGCSAHLLCVRRA